MAGVSGIGKVVCTRDGNEQIQAGRILLESAWRMQKETERKLWKMGKADGADKRCRSGVECEVERNMRKGAD